MNGKVCKLFKWFVSTLRVTKVRVVSGKRLQVVGGRPLYFGKGVRLVLGRGATCTIGSGVYLSSGCVVRVGDGANLVIEDGVYMNDCCRVTVVDSMHIGSGTLFGPNVQVYDHDHQFDHEGVHSELRSAPVFIGKRCWLCANAVVTRGCSVAARSLISANSVVTRDLLDEGSLYAGAPARLIKRYN